MKIFYIYSKIYLFLINFKLNYFKQIYKDFRYFYLKNVFSIDFNKTLLIHKERNMSSKLVSKIVGQMFFFF